jgi:hypothetical protein
MADERFDPGFDDLSSLVTVRSPSNGIAPNPADRPSTWAPVDLADVLDNNPETGPEPEFLTRSDGVALIYPARCHAFNGEPESGKTWAALLAAYQHTSTGYHVLYIDFEDSAAACVARLLAIGAHPDTLIDRFHYLHPEEPLTVRSGKITRAVMDFHAALGAWPHTLAVIDGVTEAMIVEGLSPEKNDEYATWHALLPRPMAVRGIATIQLDHVAKDRENRGRWAIGAQHKMAAIDGAAYSFEPVQPFGIGKHGIARVTVHKDRPGAVRQHAEGKRIADLHLDATTAVQCELRPPDSARDPEGNFRPTAIMEKVSRWLELNPGASLRQIREAVRGKADYVDLAVRLLIEDGYILRETGPRNSSRHSVVRPFRHNEETPDVP